MTFPFGECNKRRMGIINNGFVMLTGVTFSINNQLIIRVGKATIVSKGFICERLQEGNDLSLLGFI